MDPVRNLKNKNLNSNLAKERLSDGISNGVEVAIKEGKPSTFYVYFIRDREKNKLYLGSTNNLKKRLLEHRRHKVFSTKRFSGVDLVCYEVYTVEKEARMREKQLKYHGKAYQELKRHIQERLEEDGDKLN